MSVRLMVVEDTEHVRRMLVDILQLHGFEIAAEAGGGAEALRRLDDADPEVVVVDYKMPEMDGLEVARRVRERRPGQHIVLYSAFIDRDIERRAREVGVSACVAKPEGVEELAREISAVALDLHGHGRR